MHRIRRLGLLAAFALATPAWAVPLELTHQGRVFDSQGDPLTGAHQLTVRLYGAATGGTALWTETTSVTFDGGYYSVPMGANNGNPLDDAIFDSPVWVAVSIDQGTELPRQSIRSVPFALRADTATNVSGGVVDATSIRVDGQTIVNDDGEWVGDGNDTLATLTCAGGQLVRWNAGTSQWVCSDEFDGADVIALLQTTPVTLASGSTLGGATVSTLTLADVRADLGNTAVSLASGSTVGGTAISTLTTSGVRSDLQGSPLALASGSTVGGDPISTLTSQDVIDDIEGTALNLDSGSTIGGQDIVTPTYLEGAVALGAGSTVDGEDISTGPHFTEADVADALDAAGYTGFPTDPQLEMVHETAYCRYGGNDYRFYVEFPMSFDATPIVITGIDESLDDSGAQWSRLLKSGPNRVGIECSNRSDGLSWLAIDAGAHTIDGKKVEAGRVSSVSDSTAVFYTPSHFATAPAVFLLPEGTNPWARVLNAPTNGGFQVLVSTNSQGLQWIAFEPGVYHYGPYHFEVGEVTDPDDNEIFSFQSTFKDLPGVIFTLRHNSTSGGGNYVRLMNVTGTSFQIYVNVNSSTSLYYLAFERE